ncbi:MAG: sugar phosphate isomerase/epimerase [Candidatus Lokiarchaeota archaeon]|nr:sugar phosphate isomerase/epimerase [Candidatus Lokiarchaeota archaeon]
MLLSIVSGLEESKSNMMNINKKFSSLCQLLKSLNYDGIELSLLEPEKIDVKTIIEIKDSHDMEIPALGTGSTFIRFGYSFGDTQEFIRKKAIERIEKYIEFARETQSKVIIGLIRGRFKHDSTPQKEKLNIISSLKKCCSLAENNGVQLLFEPINRFEIDSYNTISESIKLIEEIGSNNLQLLVDSFHTHLEENSVDIWNYLKEIAHYVGHIHLADTTRRAPGTGHFDFKTFLNIFKDSGYTEFASLETIMKPSFEVIANTSREYLRKIL